MSKVTSLTKPQLAAYWRAASAAAREVGEPLDEYRKRVMIEECGVSSVKALNRTCRVIVHLRFMQTDQRWRQRGGDARGKRRGP